MTVERQRTWRVVAVLAALTLLLVACGGDAAEPGADAGAGADDAGADDAGADDAGADDAGADDAGEETSAEDRPDVALSIATGGTGGAYFPFGGALASLLSRELPHVNAAAEATGASVENIRLLEQGNVELALVQADAAFEAFNGVGPFEGEPVEIRSIVAMYPNYMQLVALAGSGIETYDDLGGARVSVGDAGSGVELTLRGIVGALGASFEDFGEVVQFGYNDQTSAFRNNQIDVGNYQGALGLAAVTDLSSSTDITILAFSDDQLDTIVEALPYHGPGVIEAGTYPGVDDDVSVPVLWNFIVVSADMDRELVYEITKTAYENQPALIAGHPEGENTTLENVEQGVVPYHPGAIDFFEEAGVDIPDELYPDEWDG